MHEKIAEQIKVYEKKNENLKVLDAFSYIMLEYEMRFGNTVSCNPNYTGDEWQINIKINSIKEIKTILRWFAQEYNERQTSPRYTSPTSGYICYQLSHFILYLYPQGECKFKQVNIREETVTKSDYELVCS